MEYNEIIEIIESCGQRKRTDIFVLSSDYDWDFVNNYFGFEFSLDYRKFTEVITKYHFELEVFTPPIIGVSDDRMSINRIYETMISSDPSWNKNFIPFGDIGNGDCYCFSNEQPLAEKVYYYDHETETMELEFNTFEEWIRYLPEFM